MEADVQKRKEAHLIATLEQTFTTVVNGRKTAAIV
jgi:hypothetical protein